MFKQLSESEHTMEIHLRTWCTFRWPVGNRGEKFQEASEGSSSRSQAIIGKADYLVYTYKSMPELRRLTLLPEASDKADALTL